MHVCFLLGFEHHVIGLMLQVGGPAAVPIIAGVVAAVVALCLAAGVAGWVMLRRRKRSARIQAPRDGSALVQVHACCCALLFQLHACVARLLTTNMLATLPA